MNKLLAGGVAVAAAITFLPIVVSTPVAHADKCNFTDATGDTACNQEIQQLWQKCRVQE
jgi:hypothetical protein